MHHTTSIAPVCNAVESQTTRILRLASSIAACGLASAVSLVAIAASFLLLTAPKSGQTAPGLRAIFCFCLASLGLTALCAVMVRRPLAAQLSLWVIPALLLCFVALAFTGDALRLVTVAPAAASPNLLLYVLVALGLVLVSTQIASRLARASSCSCT